jgi:hypothetical protein
LEMDRLRVELRIFDQQFQVKMAEIGTGPTLHNVPSVADWIGVLVRPSIGVLEPDRVDDERIAVPASNLFAEIGGVGILGVFAAVRRNQPERSVLIEKDSGSTNLKKLEPAVARIFTRDTAGRQRLSGSTVCSTLNLCAASPAAVNGSLNPGRSFPMLPCGCALPSSRQKPVRSG